MWRGRRLLGIVGDGVGFGIVVGVVVIAVERARRGGFMASRLLRDILFGSRPKPALQLRQAMVFVVMQEVVVSAGRKVKMLGGVIRVRVSGLPDMRDEGENSRSSYLRYSDSGSP